MSKVSEIYETMEYGPAPESAARALEWIESHGGSFSHWIAGSWQRGSEGETFEVLGEQEMFSLRPPEAGGAYFSIASDAQQTLIIPGTSERADSLLHLLVNWPTALKARR